jgi:hypothetical protein
VARFVLFRAISAYLVKRTRIRQRWACQPGRSHHPACAPFENSEDAAIRAFRSSYWRLIASTMAVVGETLVAAYTGSSCSVTHAVCREVKSGHC